MHTNFCDLSGRIVRSFFILGLLLGFALCAGGFEITLDDADQQVVAPPSESDANRIITGLGLIDRLYTRSFQETKNTDARLSRILLDTLHNSETFKRLPSRLKPSGMSMLGMEFETFNETTYESHVLHLTYLFNRIHPSMRGRVAFMYRSVNFLNDELLAEMYGMLVAIDEAYRLVFLLTVFCNRFREVDMDLDSFYRTAFSIAQSARGPSLMRAWRVIFLVRQVDPRISESILSNIPDPKTLVMDFLTAKSPTTYSSPPNNTYFSLMTQINAPRFSGGATYAGYLKRALDDIIDPSFTYELINNEPPMAKTFCSDFLESLKLIYKDTKSHLSMVNADDGNVYFPNAPVAIAFCLTVYWHRVALIVIERLTLQLHMPQNLAALGEAVRYYLSAIDDEYSHLNAFVRFQRENGREYRIDDLFDVLTSYGDCSQILDKKGLLTLLKKQFVHLKTYYFLADEAQIDSPRFSDSVVRESFADAFNSTFEIDVSRGNISVSAIGYKDYRPANSHNSNETATIKAAAAAVSEEAIAIDANQTGGKLAPVVESDDTTLMPTENTNDLGVQAELGKPKKVKGKRNRSKRQPASKHSDNMTQKSAGEATDYNAKNVASQKDASNETSVNAVQEPQAMHDTMREPDAAETVHANNQENLSKGRADANVEHDATLHGDGCIHNPMSESKGEEERCVDTKNSEPIISTKVEKSDPRKARPSENEDSKTEQHPQSDKKKGPSRKKRSKNQNGNNTKGLKSDDFELPQTESTALSPHLRVIQIILDLARHTGTPCRLPIQQIQYKSLLKNENAMEFYEFFHPDYETSLQGNKQSLMAYEDTKSKLEKLFSGPEFRKQKDLIVNLVRNGGYLAFSSGLMEFIKSIKQDIFLIVQTSLVMILFHGHDLGTILGAFRVIISGGSDQSPPLAVNEGQRKFVGDLFRDMFLLGRINKKNMLNLLLTNFQQSDNVDMYLAMQCALDDQDSTLPLRVERYIKEGRHQFIDFENKLPRPTLFGALGIANVTHFLSNMILSLRLAVREFEHDLLTFLSPSYLDEQQRSLVQISMQGTMDDATWKHFSGRFTCYVERAHSIMLLPGILHGLEEIEGLGYLQMSSVDDPHCQVVMNCGMYLIKGIENSPVLKRLFIYIGAVLSIDLLHIDHLRDLLLRKVYPSADRERSSVFVGEAKAWLKFKQVLCVIYSSIALLYPSWMLEQIPSDIAAARDRIDQAMSRLVEPFASIRLDNMTDIWDNMKNVNHGSQTRIDSSNEQYFNQIREIVIRMHRRFQVSPNDVFHVQAAKNVLKKCKDFVSQVEATIDMSSIKEGLEGIGSSLSDLRCERVHVRQLMDRLIHVSSAHIPLSLLLIEWLVDDFGTGVMYLGVYSMHHKDYVNQRSLLFWTLYRRFFDIPVAAADVNKVVFELYPDKGDNLVRYFHKLITEHMQWDRIEYIGYALSLLDDVNFDTASKELLYLFSASVFSGAAPSIEGHPQVPHIPQIPQILQILQVPQIPQIPHRDHTHLRSASLRRCFYRIEMPAPRINAILPEFHGLLAALSEADTLSRNSTTWRAFEGSCQQIISLEPTVLAEQYHRLAKRLKSSAMSICSISREPNSPGPMVVLMGVFLRHANTVLRAQGMARRIQTPQGETKSLEETPQVKVTSPEEVFFDSIAEFFRRCSDIYWRAVYNDPRVLFLQPDAFSKVYIKAARLTYALEWCSDLLDYFNRLQGSTAAVAGK